MIIAQMINFIEKIENKADLLGYKLKLKYHQRKLTELEKAIKEKEADL